jgi:hypothetical protein
MIRRAMSLKSFFVYPKLSLKLSPRFVGYHSRRGKTGFDGIKGYEEFVAL